MLTIMNVWDFFLIEFIVLLFSLYLFLYLPLSQRNGKHKNNIKLYNAHLHIPCALFLQQNIQLRGIFNL